MSDLKIFFGDHEVANGETLPFMMTQNQPKYKFHSRKDDLYTLIMVDPDAPYPENAKFKYYLHWIIVNNTDIVSAYHPPSPPADSNPHRYYLFLMRQKQRLDPESIEVPAERKNFPLTDFAEKYNLTDATNIYFRTGRNVQ